MALTRRQFLDAGAAAPFVIAATPHRKYKTALIGSGWWGKNILKEAIESGKVKVVALCDVDANAAEVAAGEAARRGAGLQVPGGRDGAALEVVGVPGGGVAAAGRLGPPQQDQPEQTEDHDGDEHVCENGYRIHVAQLLTPPGPRAGAAGRGRRPGS